jgi:hypothetical protein
MTTGGMTVGFMNGVLGCSAANGGKHRWGRVHKEPDRTVLGIRCRGDFQVTCRGCGVTAHGRTAAEAMREAQDFDRANRAGRLF